MEVTTYKERGTEILNRMKMVTDEFKSFVNELLSNEDLTQAQKEEIAEPMLLRIMQIQDEMRHG